MSGDPMAPTVCEAEATEVGEGQPSEPSIEAGRRIGRYIVSRRVGHGGMGVVYEAYDPKLERRVAVKVLRRSAVRRSGKSMATRMLREAQSLARLSDPHVVPVYDVGVEQGAVWVAMEYVVGDTLGRWLEHPRTWQEVVDVFVAAGRGLAAVHQAGLVHRDFKPGNVLIGSDGRVRVTDFGLARAAGPDTSEPGFESEAHPASASGFLDMALTMTGTAIGTPSYMAPEQHAGSEVDARSDQFALCISLYEALWGQRPFAGKTADELARAKASGNVRPPPRDSTVPRRVWAIVERGLSPRPMHRWPTTAALVRALAETRRRRRRVWPWVSAVAIVGGGTAWMAGQGAQRSCPQPPTAVARVWNAPRASTLRQRIEASDLPYAAHTWSTVERRLDGYVKGWGRERSDACSAWEAQPSETVEARLACLDDRLRDLEALLAVLESGDSSTIERAGQAVARLRPVDTCSQPAAQRSALEALWTEEAPEVESLRAKLRHADALARAGSMPEARKAAEAALVEARELEQPTIVAEALALVGRMRASVGTAEEAEAALQEAALMAESNGLDETAAEAAIDLTRLLAREGARLDAAHWWARRAEAAVRRVGSPALLESELLGARATLAAEEGAFARAYELYAGALEVVRSAEVERPILVAILLDSLAWTALDLGRVAEARELNDEALATFERELGPDHPDVARALIGAARLSAREGDVAKALKRFERAREIFEASLGPEHPETIFAFDEAGSVLAELGRHDEALERHEATVERLGRALGPDHPELATTHYNLGMALEQLDRDDEALEHYRRGLEISQRIYGNDHLAVGRAHNDIGVVLDKMDRNDEARSHFVRSVEIKRDVLGDTHPDLAYGFANLASLDREAGALDEARKGFERAIALLDTPDESDPVGLAFMFVDLAEIQLEQSQPEEAVRAAKRALELFASAGSVEPDPARAVAVLVEAGRTHARRDARASARANDE